ncbi:inositol monophosphatase, partial [Candidatus Woesearchaeota archaeon CG08_land_8_20_14_0_20_43_7]
MDEKNVALMAARSAGDYLLEIIKKPIKYKMKSRFDVQAEADVGSEKIILDMIRENFPDHDILSEEAGDEKHDSDYLWVIDPIDGTINFLKQLDDYCISIALEHKGELVLGVIYQPHLKRMYVAEKGKGAYLNDQKISVSSEACLEDMILSADTTTEIEARHVIFNTLLHMADKVRHIRIYGSSALHLAKLAEGKLDLYYKGAGFNYWDFAAGIVLVREAGGIVTDLGGNDIT